MEKIIASSVRATVIAGIALLFVSCTTGYQPPGPDLWQSLPQGDRETVK